jgi:hypothetical protein
VRSRINPFDKNLIMQLLFLEEHRLVSYEKFFLMAYN